MKGKCVKIGVFGLMCMLLGLLPLSGACAPAPAPPSPVGELTILKLGCLVDLTSRAAYYGKYQVMVNEDFLRWFQDDPEGYGGIPGVKLVNVPYDFHFESEKGRIGAKKLITEDKIIMGAPLWGSMTDPLVLPLQKEYEIPNVSLGAAPTALWPPTWTFSRRSATAGRSPSSGEWAIRRPGSATSRPVWISSGG